MREVPFEPRSHRNGNPYPFPVWSGCADLGTIWLLTPEELALVHRDVVVTSINGERYHANVAVDSAQETRYGYTPYGVYRNQFMDVVEAHEQKMIIQARLYTEGREGD